MKSNTRRSFLQSSLGVASFSLLHQQLGAISEAQPRDYWNAIRAQFPFRETKVPMNAANLCPSPRTVSDSVTSLTRDIDVDCSFNNRAKFGDLVEEGRSSIAGMLRVSADEIAIVRNTSEANNIVNSGLTLGSSDEVLLWTQNHPTNNVAWEVRAERMGFGIRRFDVPARPQSEADLVTAVLNSVNESTRVIAVSHLSNVSGIRLPITAISRGIQGRNIWLHVDGAQTWGAFDLDLRGLGCDSFASSSHKWFMGPKEAGILYIKEARIPELWPFGVAPGWGNDAETDLRGARKFESLGQRDDACLAAMAVAAEFHKTIGPARIQQRVQAINTALKEKISAMGARLVTPSQPELSGGVTILEMPGAQRREAFNRLYETHGIAGAATGGLRLSPHVYNTDQHIDRAAEAIQSLKPYWT